MNVIFITRCYKPTNLQRIKDNLKSVFEKQDKISYVQYLLVDLSYNQPQQNFKCFEDEHTKVIFTHNKKDYYNNAGIDEVLQTIPNDQNTFVFVLDDDNLIKDDFTKVFDNYNGEDVLVVDWFREPFTVGNIVGKGDTRNCIVKLKVRKETPIYIEGAKSYSADGVFIENLVKKGYSFKYLNLSVSIYAAMKRPLNVLRSNL